ncbi:MULTISPECIES: glycosyltransferase family A protein [unclassified Pseudodesulfovibrio]|uniref:glycosyltransferase family A protein n=1 Tax=unclassified Pseudodesulfovibrio TaxID=2661612 RepID=UPI000FEC0BFB|nr:MULTISPECIES: glycosyltransferase family A protein [unclassified Pseudodesulfovibrio]MCJ2165778.1 glycosyltransferase family 2 protein [Pseudodesulfovibrio sp. S3-i]RWU02854.1 glycosyltransferase family 2 protein [Pseudodesulfovibrio sp. S3]
MTRADTDSLTGFWRSLPEELKVKLRLGFTGKGHLLDVADWCLRSGAAALVPVAADALHNVVREHPLDGGVARELLASGPARPLLTPETLDRLNALAVHWRRPDDLEAFLHLLAGREYSEISRFLRQAVAEQPDNLFWREQAMMVGSVEGDSVFVSEVLDFDTVSGVEKVIYPAKSVAKTYFSPKADPNVGQLLATLRQRPWDVSLALRAHDLFKGVAKARQPVPGSAAILLYSWNKADELDATLASLLASDLGDASVFVLDNGSTDCTGEVLAGWESRFADQWGAGRFTVVTLPVNIGAAPARNWLLHMDAVRTHEFVCYLDDDVELPEDWFLLLGAAVAEYPDAGVWGCKVVDHSNPLLIQNADTHLLAGPGSPTDLARMAPNPFKLSDLHIQTLDSGLFDFLRPCASVTGCCHLFRTETLLDSGDFAIQLSPSQYDDMEHDLRLCEAGLFPVYQGHLTIRHKKRTGAASRTSMQEEGNALGNKYKMQTMHDPAAIKAAMLAEQQFLEADLLAKLDYLDTL